MWNVYWVQIRLIKHDRVLTVKVRSGHSGAIVGRRAYTGSLGQRQEAVYEYGIFVKKEDYKKAKHVIRK